MRRVATDHEKQPQSAQSSQSILLLVPAPMIDVIRDQEALWSLCALWLLSRSLALVLLQRERRIFIHEREDVGLDADQPSERADAEVVQALRVFGGDADDD